MFYSDEALILRRGPQISAKLLQPIGVFDQSLCWGVKLPDLRSRERGKPHLLIAPIHPDSWPFVFRIRVALRHGVGTLEKLSEVLTKNYANIVVVEGGPAGHHHASLNIICEALSVKEDLLPRKKNDIDFVSDENRDLETRLKTRFKFSGLLAESMFKFISKLKKEIMAAHQEDGGAEYDKKVDLEISKDNYNDPSRDSGLYSYLTSRNLIEDVGFLHHRFVRGWQSLYEESSISSKFKEEVDANRIDVVSCRWLENLAFFSIYGSSTSRPMSFVYDERSRVLSVEKGKVDYDEFIRPYDPPTLAVASFDNVENYVRFSMLERSRARVALDRIQVGYSAEFTKDGKASRGIMATVCKEIRERNVNLLRVTQTVMSLDDRGETGKILFVGEAQSAAEAGDLGKADKRRESLERSLGKLRSTPLSRNTKFRIDSVEVGPYRPRYLFVSMPFEDPDALVNFEEKIITMVTKVAKEEGWITVTSRTYTEDLGPTIEKKIKECNAFLQIAYLGKDVDPESADFAYLHYEYGVAKGREKPVLRLVETAKQTMDYWRKKLRIDPGKDLREFDHDARGVEEVFRDSVKKLEKSALRVVERR